MGYLHQDDDISAICVGEQLYVKLFGGNLLNKTICVCACVSICMYVCVYVDIDVSIIYLIMYI